jgi:hypothetical protein
MDLFFSIDVETLGSTPGLNPMLSLGAVAVNEQGEYFGEFYVTLIPSVGSPDPRTARWWEGFPAQYAEATKNQKTPQEAMREFDNWVASFGRLRGKPVMAVWPWWDAMWIHYYEYAFLGRSIFNRRVICIKTLAKAFLGSAFSETGKGSIPKEWKGGIRHTHNALEDAREQAAILINVLAALKNQKLAAGSVQSYRDLNIPNFSEKKP